jgi:hypothetical protein
MDDIEEQKEFSKSFADTTTPNPTIIRLAHISVKEHLTSERIQVGAASFYSIDEKLSNIAIAKISRSCLLQFDSDSVSDSNAFSDNFPLAKCAAQYWIEYAFVDATSVIDMALLLFPSEDRLRNWIALYDSMPNIFQTRKFGHQNVRARSYITLFLPA